jgi:hypothetical protein
MFAAPKTSGLGKKNKFIDLSEGRASDRSLKTSSSSETMPRYFYPKYSSGLVSPLDPYRKEFWTKRESFTLETIEPVTDQVTVTNVENY